MGFWFVCCVDFWFEQSVFNANATTERQRDVLERP